MKHFYFSTLLLLFTPLILLGQSNFKKGFVVTTQGDTLRGYIDYKEWIKNPKSISFKTTPENNDKQEFTPLNSSYFQIEDFEAYLTYHGRVSADKTNLKDIPTSIDTSKVNVQVFLKILQEGKNVTLFMLSDDLKVRFFLMEKKEKNIQELNFRRYKELGKGDKIRNSKIFIGQLLNMANKYNVGSSKFKRQIEQANYFSTDLLKIVSVINNIDQNSPQVKSGRESYRFFAGAGLNKSTTRIVGNHILAHQEANVKTSVLPKIIIGSDLFLNPNVRRIILRGELSFTKTNQELSRQEGNITGRQEFQQNIFTFFPQVLYNIYNGELCKLFLGSGLSAHRVFYPSNSYSREESFINGATYRIGSENYYRLDKFWFIIPVKAGITFNNLELSAIYFPPITISKYHDFAFVTKSVHIQLNYILNK